MSCGLPVSLTPWSKQYSFCLTFLIGVSLVCSLFKSVRTSTLPFGNASIHRIVCSDIYHISFPKDPRWRKAVVAGIYMLETLQLIIATYEAFGVYAKGWGNLAAFDDVGIDWLSGPVLTAISKRSKLDFV